MTVAFITIHVGYNFGSVLQTIATSEILKKARVEPICINYIPPRVTGKRYWKEGKASIIKFFRRLLFYPIHYLITNNYRNYLAKYCTLTKPIYSEDDFSEKCPEADFYMIGSDQVWNYKHNEGIDKHYFFDGIEGKKIAFASSIGMAELPDEYADYMKNALKDFSAISVREASAVELLSHWGIQSTQIIDPTLMLTKEQWFPYASKRLCHRPYIFVYLPYNITNKETIYSTVQKIAKSKNLQVISYSWYYQSDSFADKTIKFANPGDILSLFIHADYIITNSFHGTAFSINLNKQFWVYMPSHFSTRLMSLIELCDLKDRILDDIIADCKINNSIDFSQSNHELNKEREKAISFISKALS